MVNKYWIPQYLKGKLTPNIPWQTQSGRTGMALLILNLGTRWGWVFKAKPWLLYPWEPPIPTVGKAGWAPGPVWMGMYDRKSLNTIGVCSSDSPVSSKSLHQLHHPGNHLNKYCMYTWKMKWHLQTLGQKMWLPVHL